MKARLSGIVREYRFQNVEKFYKAFNRAKSAFNSYQNELQKWERLIAGGVAEIIAAGCCGALVDDTEGSFFIPTAALRQEGTSYHYLPPSREVALDDNPIEAICRTLDKAKLSYKKCKTWTTDGFYRETKEMVFCGSYAACNECSNGGVICENGT